jgi:ferredoxin-type protein NapH
MKRQKVRRALVIISFLLFPITIYYLSPYLIIMGALEGVITGSFIAFACMLLFALFFGRAYCGWVCPVGGLQDCLSLANDKKTKGGRRNLIKYIIWVPWLILIAFSALSADGYRKVDFLYMTFHGISISEPYAYIIYYVVILLITLPSLIAGRRSFCHYFCWMAPFMVIGRKLGNLLKLPSLRLKADSGKCTHCRQCSKNCPMSLDIEQMVSNGSLENTECILCGECTGTCPKKVLHYTFGTRK